MDPQYAPNSMRDNDFTFRERHAHRRDVTESLTVIVANGLVAALGFRFVFALFDANPANAIASFVKVLPRHLSRRFTRCSAMIIRVSALSDLKVIRSLQWRYTVLLGRLSWFVSATRYS